MYVGFKKILLEGKMREDRRVENIYVFSKFKWLFGGFLSETIDLEVVSWCL